MPFADLLLRWYDEHARALPWRGIHNPYHTWVSETMLQQTRVETVLSYYQRFIDRFPTVEALAAAPEDEVLKLWEGLGYYRRARNLHKGAQQVVREFGGVIPADVKELMKISGIGEYTAGAIASIAFDQAVPAVDGNVIRVVSRVRGIRENVGVPSVKRRIAQEAGLLVSRDRPGDFNQAMMDLGATVCVPGTPSCERCPVAELCDACRAGDPEDIPELPRKNPPRAIDYDLCLIFNGDRVLMRQRTETMLQGLWVFPMVEEHHTLKQLPPLVKRRLGLRVTDVQPAGEAKHIFTHQVWQMRLHTMQTAAEAPAGWRFVTLEEMDGLTIPTAVKKAVAVVRDRIK
ncbi:MAG: A/G-specific adenine glycosylase [Clostridiales bacterium]|nr:A/G-specific adenine glycosylase [Clostridiales bacterium]